MATLLAAGAASCAGYIIGNLAVTKTPRRPHRRHAPLPSPYVHHAQRVHHLPPRQVMPQVPHPTQHTGSLHAGYVPAPKRVMPGQCSLCESWFQHGDVVAKLYCGHVFHRQCMETFARQPVYENFRCTCVVCRGGSWVTRFAVTEINTPAAPSIAPFTPLPLPTVSAPTAIPPPPVAQPVAPPLPPVVPVPPAPTPVPPVAQSVMSSIFTGSTTSTCTHHTAGGKKTPPLVQPPVQTRARTCGGNTKHHTFISLDGTDHPSCTLCACKLCVQNTDGNCGKCGRCLCYECMYADCECCCTCVPDLPDASEASFNDFVPLY